jgi:hypothetical protein
MREIRLSLMAALIISLMLVSFAGTTAEIYAQDAPPQLSELTALVSSIEQDTQAAVYQWHSDYYAGSIEEFRIGMNPGLAATGPYSTLVSGATLKIEELPYYGPTGLPTL